MQNTGTCYPGLGWICQVHLGFGLSASAQVPDKPALLSYFPVFVYMWCLLPYILSLIAYTFRENREFVFIIIVQFMMSANSRIRFGLPIEFLWFVQHTISLLSLCKLIWRHWTYKMPVRFILSSVRLSIFSQLSFIQYVGLCVLVYPFPLWWLR